MAFFSVIAASQALYASLTPSLFPGGTLPPIELDKPPDVEGGSQAAPPYVVMIDGGMTPNYDFEYYVVESTRLTLDIFAPTLAQCDQIVEAIKYNGGGSMGGQGFDMGNFPNVPSNYQNLKMTRVKEQRNLAGRGTQAARVYKCRVEFVIQLERIN